MQGVADSRWILRRTPEKNARYEAIDTSA